MEGIEWLGHDSFRIGGSATVYIDPWQLAKGAAEADLVLVTHEHFDHFSKDDIASVSTSQTVVVGPAEVTGKLKGGADADDRPRADPSGGRRESHGGTGLQPQQVR